MIPQDTVNTILDTARIDEVVGDFVTLKRRGASFVACCPFHNEKTPSFYVTPSKGIFKCFGCGKSGSAVGFVMEHEHCSYAEALKYLAAKYHIEIQEEELSADEIMKRQRTESIMLASEFAQKFFVSALADTDEGRTYGMAYLRKRGLEDDTIRRYGLGWAPSGRTGLLNAARDAGIRDEYLIAAGLCVQREDGTILDKFYERVMFPIHSVSGRVIAYSGRTLRTDGDIAKYVNSPETEIYVKSRALLGIYFAKAEISRVDKCYLVEGNLDVISMHQLGITNVVASCGTSLTIEQIRLIRKFTQNLTIMYDGDKAGIHAALRGINMVLAEGMNVRIVLLPDGDDPDSFSRKHTLEEVRNFIDGAERDFVSFKTDLLLEEAQGDPYRKSGLINDIADTIAEIPDDVTRSVYVEDCAMKFGIESQILFDRIAATRRKQRDERAKEAEREARRAERVEAEPTPAQQAAPERAETCEFENPTVAPAERDLLSFLLTSGRDIMDFPTDGEMYVSEEDKSTVCDFIRCSLDTPMVNSLYRKTYDEYLRHYDAGEPQDNIVRALLDSPDRQISAVVSDLALEKYKLTVKSFAAAMSTKSSWLVTQVPRAIYFYCERRLESQIDEVQNLMKTADAAELDDLMLRFVRLEKNLKEIKNKLKYAQQH